MNDTDRRDAEKLGMSAGITRRDFLNGTLAATLAIAGPGARASASTGSSAGALGPEWTGPGGIGDYHLSNGNTHEVVNAAHAVRDGRFDHVDAELEPDEYDLVIVGSGITGLTAAREFQRLHGEGKRCLILDNHRMFGGEAKGNVFQVGAYRIAAPQGSNAFASPGASGPVRAIWDDLQIPTEFTFREPAHTQGGLRVARDHYGPMLYTAEQTSVGYWFRNERTGGHGEWHKDIWNDRLRSAPLSEAVKRDLLRWKYNESVPLAPGMAPLPDASDLYAWRKASEDGGLAPWLDSMSYADFLEKVMQLSPAVSRHIDPLVGVGISGTASDAVSAYAAQRVLFPGVTPHMMTELYEKAQPMTSPIGNGLIARYLVKALIPDAIPGDYSLQSVLRHPVDPSALDRPGAVRRLRLAATAVRVEHEGSPDTAEAVRVTYSREGRTFAVRARHLIMAGGGWMNRHVARDLPPVIRDAYATFCNGPVLTANVALNHWRFMDRLGISAARWFDGLGFFANFIRPMLLGGPEDAPLDPTKPVVLTWYIPFLHPGLPAAAQCAAGRAELFDKSFADFELQIRRQMQLMFGAHGFDARRDIAGLVLNRWGHAYICPQPGFFFGRDGNPAAREAVRAGYGRIAFAHAELQGTQNWYAAASEAKRAAQQVSDRMSTA